MFVGFPLLIGLPKIGIAVGPQVEAPQPEDKTPQSGAGQAVLPPEIKTEQDSP
jgi:hypothetical protein